MGSPALILALGAADISSLEIGRGSGGLGLGSQGDAGGEENSLSECSEVISISKSGETEMMGSGMEVIVSKRGSSATIDSCCVLISRFRQVLDILLLPIVPGELLIPDR